MPQLDFFSYLSLTIYSIVGFFILLFVMHTYYLPKIGQALKLREILRQPDTLDKIIKSKIVNKVLINNKFVNPSEFILQRIQTINQTINKKI
jgi:hypothetical protein